LAFAAVRGGRPLTGYSVYSCILR